MGLFDYFTKEATNEKKPNKTRTANIGTIEGSSQPDPTDDNVSVRVFKPTSFLDVKNIINFLMLNKPAVVNLEAVSDDTIQRVIDMLSGACYALHGDISEISKNIYLISPEEKMI